MAPETIAYGDEPTLLAACPDAWGLRFVREGFGFDAIHDQLFALGFPHLHWLVKGQKADGDPAASALASLKKYEPDHRLVWPVETARRWVRCLGSPYLGRNGKLSKKGEASVGSGPVDAAEAAGLLQHVLKKDGKLRQQYRLEDLVLLLEAMVGAIPVTEAIVGTLEALKPTAWFKPSGSQPVPHDIAHVIHALGFVLLRVPQDKADPLRERLARLLAARGQDAAGALPTRLLDVVLAGSEGLERSAPRLAGGERNPLWYAHGIDGEALVRSAAIEHTGPYELLMMDARLVFLGGQEVLEAYGQRWTQLKTGAAQQFFIATVGEVRAVPTVALMADLLQRSKAKKAAKAWLKAHADYARPVLETLATADADKALAAL